MKSSVSVNLMLTESVRMMVRVRRSVPPITNLPRPMTVLMSTLRLLRQESMISAVPLRLLKLLNLSLPT